IQQFNAPAISHCLKGKMVHMYGDSTIRQWYEFLAKLPDLRKFDLHNPIQAGPFMALNFANNILLTYRCHGPPIRFSTVPTSNFPYVANEIDGLKGGTDTVVVLSVWAHFNAFPMEVYIRRLMSIRRAVVRLLERAPGTLVIIRTANPRELDFYQALNFSDWYALQRSKVLRAIFKGLNVHLINAWQMVVAHHLQHELHPKPPIIKNMIDILMSYICPPKGG
ncbi:NXPE family member 3-like, partial [Plectropomus leopardus]|uniref:NXPE family member 3-like n=1 Tax=Plectropomus leopardus TaxID=160734 RepID=UPI001C4BB3DC